jgi:hypothetical protein
MAARILGRLLDAASLGRGAMLWIPASLVALYLVLFGIRLAPRGESLFTRTTGTRLALGAWAAPRGSETASAHLVAGLRRELSRHGDLALVDSLRVARNLLSTPGAREAPEAFLLALRPLNPHLGLRGRLEPRTTGVWAELEAWDVHERRRVFAAAAEGAVPEIVARALADSLRAALRGPGMARAGMR